MSPYSPEDLRRLVAEDAGRPFDLAERLGVPEAALVAAETGRGTTRIDATPGRLIPMVECRNLTQLGEFVHDLA